MKLAILLLSGACIVTISPAQAQGRYNYSSDGSEVTDSQTGLIWRRCTEGMAWSGGTCTGIATNYTHEATLLRATTQSGWRLPNVKELTSIVDFSRTKPAIDLAAFPATSSGQYWSSSPYAGDSSYAWAVGFDFGMVNGVYRNGFVTVRLVR